MNFDLSKMTIAPERVAERFDELYKMSIEKTYPDLQNLLNEVVGPVEKEFPEVDVKNTKSRIETERVFHSRAITLSSVNE